VRWNALRVGERLHFVIEEAGDVGLLGQIHDGTVTEVRPKAKGEDIIVVVFKLDQGIFFKGELLRQVLLKARFVQTFVITFLSFHQTVYVSPVLPGPYDFKTVFGLAWLRRLSASQERGQRGHAPAE
jgi:hypothetical protein